MCGVGDPLIDATAMCPRLRTGVEPVVLVALGGFVGAVGRYLLGIAVPGPGGTLVVNVAGSFALGLLLYRSLVTGGGTERIRLLVGTGLISSFTTYSTFAVESVQSGPPLLVANVVGTYALGFGAVIAGRWVVAVRWEGAP